MKSKKATFIENNKERGRKRSFLGRRRRTYDNVNVSLNKRMEISKKEVLDEKKEKPHAPELFVLIHAKQGIFLVGVVGSHKQWW